MFSATYMFSELRRRKGRTFLTALGLAVGVGLVVTVNALSTGLDRAQAKVLKPLTGVGTDMTVSRPIAISSSSGSSSGPGGFQSLSPTERAQLEKENGSTRFGLRNLGKPGTHFSSDQFVAAAQLSFPASKVTTIGNLAGVSSAAGGLTLNAIHVAGTVPKQTQAQGTFGGPPQTQGPRSVNFNSLTVSGVDQHHPELGAITSGQITKGRYFSATATS